MAVPCGSEGLGGVFDQEQARVGLLKRGEGVPIGALAVEMDGKDRFYVETGILREDFGGGFGGEVEGEGVDIGEEGAGSGAQDAGGGGEEAEGGGDDSLASEAVPFIAMRLR